MKGLNPGMTSAHLSLAHPEVLILSGTGELGMGRGIFWKVIPWLT